MKNISIREAEGGFIISVYVESTEANLIGKNTNTVCSYC